MEKIYPCEWEPCPYNAITYQDCIDICNAPVEKNKDDEEGRR